MGIELVLLAAVAAAVGLRLGGVSGPGGDPGALASAAWWLVGTGLGAAALGLLPRVAVGDAVAAAVAVVGLLLGGVTGWLVRARGWRQDREAWLADLPEPERAEVAWIVGIHGRIDDLEEADDEGSGWSDLALTVLGSLAVVTSLVAGDAFVFVLGGLLLTLPVQRALEWQVRRRERTAVTRLLPSTDSDPSAEAGDAGG